MAGRVYLVILGVVLVVLGTVDVILAPPTGGYSPPPSLLYLIARTRFLKEESKRFLGSSLTLTAEEVRVNAILMDWKRHEYTVPEVNFPPAHSFFNVREDIEKSRVFKFIRSMPKGAVLHVHDLAAVNADFIVNDLSHRENLWGQTAGKKILLRFSRTSPGSGWELVSDLRRKAPSQEEFDARIRASFTITDPNPDVTYPDQATVWSAFNDVFNALFATLTYEPVFRDYFYHTLQEFYEDNVMYVEIRGVLPEVYDLDGNTKTQLEVARLYKEVADNFTSNHPDFLGVRLIYAPSRHVPVMKIREYLVFFRKLKETFPDFVAGFDLVAHEDDGRPLIDFVPALLKLRQDIPDVKYFFHAGETNWEQSQTDENLVDAVLLGTTRIGHGFAIDKHPMVMDTVKAMGIGIELNPISNQVLNLVKDLRNHPGAALLADDYPVVISSDDPGMWGARGLSHDFYEAFLGMAGLKADLRTLKQLAVNSIKYSAMGDSEKERALSELSQRWNRFISGVLRTQRSGHFATSNATEHDNSILSTSFEGIRVAS